MSYEENKRKVIESINVEKLDSVLTSLMLKFRSRAMIGKQKYGTDMDRDDLSMIQWLRHAQEEAMDQSIYLEKLIQEYEKEIKWNSNGN